MHPSQRVQAGSLALIMVAATVATVFCSHLGEWLSLAGIRSNAGEVSALVGANPLPWIIGFAVFCVIATAICFPVGPVMGVTAGALFGVWPGAAVVVLAGTIGSTLAFLASRFLFRELVEDNLGPGMEHLNDGFASRGAVYLLSLRLNPLMPYWLVNLGMGLTRMRVATYLPVTLIGLAPAKLIYSYAGSQLATLTAIGDIFSPLMILALLLLSLFPLLATQLAPLRAASRS